MRLRSTLVALVILVAFGAANLVAAASSPKRKSPASLVSSLTTAQLAGQRVIYSYNGLTPPPTLGARIRAGEVAGVIFFANNIASDAQIKAVVAGLQADAMESPVKLPLLMMVDQEGGEVRRLSGQPLLSEKQIGAATNPGAAAASAGRNAAHNLKSVGINVNLAPVLDVYSQAGNFIDRYGRSYSQVPATVAQLGADFIRAQQQAGVAATAKHFPGLGTATRNQDTDVSPVTLNVPLGTLRSVSELPYRAAITAGVKLVMVSWARYPALDPARPAGLSATVVQGELRQRLGFRGVTITDALEAGALRDFGSTAKRAVLAAVAGMDLILCSGQQVGEGIAAANSLAQTVASGTASRSGFATSVQRVLALRQSLQQ
jgi:beta-N-acetylhexosaminidase